ncbi:DUF721 domain-containing protein [Anaerohalosphaeraceae bacterium U12dextr]
MSKQSESQQEQYLRSATAWQKKTPPGPQPLGEALSHYMNVYVKGLRCGGTIAAAFEQVIGTELAPYYRADRFTRGILYIQSPPGPYLHRLKMMETEIVEKLQAHCPGTRIKEIRIQVKGVGRKTR